MEGTFPFLKIKDYKWKALGVSMFHVWHNHENNLAASKTNIFMLTECTPSIPNYKMFWIF
jgi:hypothetical protein